jgi:hypothetical protein
VEGRKRGREVEEERRGRRRKKEKKGKAGEERKGREGKGRVRGVHQTSDLAPQQKNLAGALGHVLLLPDV